VPFVGIEVFIFEKGKKNVILFLDKKYIFDENYHNYFLLKKTE
jgi:hypothetical protein